MDRNQGRRLSAEEKLRVVVEGRQAGAMISEVCWRHQVNHAQITRGVILAAGDGDRMGELTRDRPKVLLPIYKDESP